MQSLDITLGSYTTGARKVSGDHPLFFHRTVVSYIFYIYLSLLSGRITRQEKQLSLLLTRQKEWKEAAIDAKKAGNITKAKDCLRQAKGFDSLIEASRSGLPIDMSSVIIYILFIIPIFCSNFVVKFDFPAYVGLFGKEFVILLELKPSNSNNNNKMCAKNRDMANPLYSVKSFSRVSN